MNSTEIYKLVAEKTGQTQMALFASTLVDTGLNNQERMANWLLAWTKRMQAFTYQEIRVMAQFDHDSFAPIFLIDERYESAPMIKVQLDVGRALLSTLSPIELHHLEVVVHEIFRSLSGVLKPEEGLVVRDLFKIGLAGCLTSADARNNYWALFVMPLIGFQPDGEDDQGLAVQLAMLLRTREEAESLGFLDE